MKKFLCILVCVGVLLSIGSLGFAEEEEMMIKPVVAEPQYNLRAQIESQPVNVFDYADMFFDWVTSVANKLLKTTRPSLGNIDVYWRNGEAVVDYPVGIQVTIWDTKTFDGVLGAMTNERGYLAMEISFEELNIWQDYLDRVSLHLGASFDTEFKEWGIMFGLAIDIRSE